MGRRPSKGENVSNLLADEYVGRILSATYNKPMSVQQISYKCNIPIAVAYRRISKMEDSGLIKCVGEDEVYRGKKVRYYQCAIKRAQFTFDDGRFSFELDWLSEDLLNNDGLEEA
jgi:predicted transcriptional regulator